MNPLPAPTASAGDRCQQIRPDAAFDPQRAMGGTGIAPGSGEHVPHFLDGLEALVFFGAWAFGLRASLVDRICPLAIAQSPRSPTWSWWAVGVVRAASRRSSRSARAFHTEALRSRHDRIWSLLCAAARSRSSAANVRHPSAVSSRLRWPAGLRRLPAWCSPSAGAAVTIAVFLGDAAHGARRRTSASSAAWCVVVQRRRRSCSPRAQPPGRGSPPSIIS